MEKRIYTARPWIALLDLHLDLVPNTGRGSRERSPLPVCDGWRKMLHLFSILRQPSQSGRIRGERHSRFLGMLRVVVPRVLAINRKS